MLKIENVVTPSPEQWRAIIMGARNPMNSWNRSDSEFEDHCLESWPHDIVTIFENLGSNDHDLLMRLRNAGTDHRKFMRMITVYVDITAPLYWWKEFDTYKVGTVANSCSTMHKIAAKEFTLEDFSCEHLVGRSMDAIKNIINDLNFFRSLYMGDLDVDKWQLYRNLDKKDIWWQMIQLLPSSYNQKRTVMLNYEVLVNIYKSRRNHKLDEWCEHKNIDVKTLKRFYDGDFKLRDQKSLNDIGFCDWIKTLPYCELITGKED